MKPKPVLKPKKYPKRVRFERTLDFREFKQRVEAFLPEKRADQLAFDLMEIDEACETFRRDIKLLFAALRSAKRNSVDLRDRAAAVSGDIIEFRNHFRTAFPAMCTLMAKARELPPLDKISDDQLTDRILAPLDAIIGPPTTMKKRASNKTKKRTPRITAQRAKRTR